MAEGGNAVVTCWVKVVIGFGLTAAMLAMACSSGVSNTATPSFSPASGTTATAPPAPLTPSPLCAAASHGPIPGHAADEVTVNADGDGVADRLFTSAASSPDEPPTLYLVLDERAVVGVPLPMRHVPVAAIGGFDANGDGRDELFVKTGEGAYATLIDVYEYDTAACTLVRLAAPGAVPAQFGVGASVGNGTGLACEGGNLVATMFTRISDQPLRYSATWTTYAIEGTVLIQAELADGELDAAEAARAATFNCGGLRLPPFGAR